MSFANYVIFANDALTIVANETSQANACEKCEEVGGYILDMRDQVWRDDQFAEIPAPTSSVTLEDGEAA